MKPFNVMTCIAAPFFDHMGGATQYRLYEDSIPEITNPNVKDLLNLNYITEIFKDDSRFTKPSFR